MTRSFIRASILALGVVIVALGAWRWRLSRIAAPALPDYGIVSPFTLTDQDGKPFGSAALSGKIWLADFVFTRCMGPCPLLTTRMAELQKQFKDNPRVAFVSFTVDPDFDQPTVLAKYAASYGADGSTWKFLTGQRETVYDLIRKNFKLAVAPDSGATAGEVDITHSTYFVLVDGASHIHGFYNSLEPLALIHLKDDIRKL